MSNTLIVGRYRLVKRLAAGGMGTVWEGWDERLLRPVAIKQLHRQLGLSPAQAESVKNRAMREARLTARLHHPNAVPVYDVVDDDGQPCLIMQYLPSTSLQQLVADKGVLAPATVARIGSDIASALAQAHRAGIVHRDVKPGNVLIAEDGTAKITDFGISHALDDISVTSTGLVSGTPAYLAPEVARGRDSTFASDVFSLGSTLYLALEGTPPFGTETNPMAMLHRVASADPHPLTRSGPLSDVLGQMLAVDQADRPPMIDVARRLGAIAEASADADSPTVVRPAPLPSTPTTALRVEPAASSLPGGMPLVLPPGPPPDPGRPDPERAGFARRRSLLVPLLAVLVVVGLAVVLAIVLIGNSGGSHNATPTPTPTRSSATSSLSGSSGAKTTSTVAPSSATSSSVGASAIPTGAQLAQAVTDYYALLPDDLDAAWARLTPRFQQGRAGGRKTFDDYWDEIRSVSVSGVSGQPPGTVEATVSYVYKTGKTVAEHTSFTLVRQNGVLEIDATGG